MSKTITVEKLAGLQRSPDLTLVDGRPIQAYNGWRLHGEPRGGHIPGAVAFPQSWVDGAFDPELVSLLAKKGITPDRRVVLYGYDDGSEAVFAGRLEAIGYEHVEVLEGGQPKWAAQPELELVTLPRYRQLVYPEWLHRLLNGEQVEDGPQGPWALFHVNYGVPKDYEMGHLPGAIHLDTNALESSEDWNRRSPAELTQALVELGITKDTTVVVYGRDCAPNPKERKPGQKAGQIAATRAAAILMYAGVEDVRFLDGGLNRWLWEGYELETEARLPTPAAEFGTTVPVHPEYFIDYDEAVALLADPEGALVSMRSKPEYQGKTSGYNYIRQTGDIPGAIWGNCGTSAYNMKNYRNADNTMRSFHDIASDWAEVGITPDKAVSFYCGTGWRASETFFYAHLMGWPRVSVYDGGWFEWSRRTGDAA